jgi:hypothetical protein
MDTDGTNNELHSKDISNNDNGINLENALLSSSKYHLFEI